jgi:hypothetical protein
MIKIHEKSHLRMSVVSTHWVGRFFVAASDSYWGILALTASLSGSVKPAK